MGDTITLYTRNILESGTVTVTGDPDAGFPESRLHDRAVSLFWKDTATEAKEFTVQQAGYIPPVDAATKLLLHMDGPDASTNFVDSSPSAHAITVVDNAKISTAQKKFGTGSCYINDATSHIKAPDSADWHMGSGAFTVDFWVYFNDTLAQQIFFQQSLDPYDSGNYAHLVLTSSGTSLVVICRSGGGDVWNTTLSWTPATGQWYHVALIRGWGGSANNLAVTINGQLLGSVIDVTGDVWPDYTGPLLVCGGRTPAAWRGVQGYVDEFRVSKGVARWTANFSPPDVPYPLPDWPGVDFLAIFRHNFSGRAMQWQHSDNGADWTDALADWTQPDNEAIIKTLPAAVNHKHWRVTLASMQDPRCGEIFMSCGRSFEVKSRPAPAFDELDNVQWNRSIGGLERSTKFGDVRRQHEYNLLLSPADQVEFKAALAELDHYSRPFWIKDTEGDHWLCRLSGPPRLIADHKTHVHIRLDVIEML